MRAITGHSTVTGLVPWPVSTSRCWTFRARQPVGDPVAFLRAAIAWHFGEDTGSPFWLRAAKTLDFDPLTDIETFDDLRRFPEPAERAAKRTVDDLIPRGYGTPAPDPADLRIRRHHRGAETNRSAARLGRAGDPLAGRGFRRGRLRAGGGLVCLMPSGPHGVGYFSRSVSERLGSTFHGIDLDPRWVKKLTARGAAAEVSMYVDHVLEQAEFILQTQHVANLHTSPPLFEAIARNDRLVDLVNEKIRYVLLSGAHVDIDTLELLREIFPQTAITMAFGSTMILSQAITRHDDRR